MRSLLPRWNEVTALFGGTFDPPHLGHREAVQGLFERPGVGRVIVLPSAIPPLKTATIGAEHRIEMARISFSSQPSHRDFPREVQVDPREIVRSAQNPGRPSYTFDTLIEIQREIPEIAFVIGIDQLEKLPSWHRFPEVMALCHWIVLLRKPDGELLARSALGRLEGSGLLRSMGDQTWKITSESSPRNKDLYMKLVETEARALSSSSIRESIGRTGLPPEGTLLPEVLAYLKQIHGYGIRPEAN